MEETSMFHPDVDPIFGRPIAGDKAEAQECGHEEWKRIGKSNGGIVLECKECGKTGTLTIN